MNFSERKFWLVIGEVERLTRSESAALKNNDLLLFQNFQEQKAGFIHELTQLEAFIDLSCDQSQERKKRIVAIEAEHNKNSQAFQERLNELKGELEILKKEKGRTGKIKRGYLGPSPDSILRWA